MIARIPEGAGRFRFLTWSGYVCGYVEDVAVVAGCRVFVERADVLEGARARAELGSATGLLEPVPGRVRVWLAPPGTFPLESTRAVLVPISCYAGPDVAEPTFPA